MSSGDFVPGAQTGELKARRTRAPPPPPPGGSAAPVPVAASSSYYGNATAASRPSRTVPPPRKSQPPRRAPPAAAPAAARPSAQTFYGTGNGYPAASASNPSAASGGSSYYGAPAPTPAVVPAPSPFGPSTETSNIGTNNDGWYSSPAPAATSGTNDTGWYSAAPQAAQYAAVAPQPAVTPSFSNFAPMQSQHRSSELLAGAMDGGATFVPAPMATMQSSSNIDEEDEPPLLEELGIHMDHILIKTRAVVLPFSRFGHREQDVMHEDSDDLWGPLAFALLLGGELLLTGKLQFGYIYGFGLFGCLSMTLVLNLMSPVSAISVWTVASILGYALLPVNLLAVIKILVVNLGKLEMVGRLLALLTITWCTIASTRLLEQRCDMRDQRYLVAYPIALLYSAFVMITIF